jgi:hypothetical protein
MLALGCRQESKLFPTGKEGMAEEKEGGFRVTDRRKFNSDGSPRDAAEDMEEAAEHRHSAIEIPPVPVTATGNVVSFPSEPARTREPEVIASGARPARAEAPAASPGDSRAAQARAAAKAAEQAYNESRNQELGGDQIVDGEMEDSSFLALIDMFATEAAAHLGMAQTPDGKRTPVDLEGARHWIDLIGMLEQKTKGNLTAEESGVIENVLAYLRMQFVGASKKR